ncbi:MAG TPA: hypothetical protein VFN37_14620 [Candidatus Baltobacteraceae bacterium]|nr:hypothetical protein [Candidatus Baltobacteraceae bacterium]
MESHEAFRILHALLVEYERDLPPDLRHGEEPAPEDATRTYAGDNAAFLARFEDGYGGRVAVTMLDAATAISQRLYVQPSRRGAGGAGAWLGVILHDAVLSARERTSALLLERRKRFGAGAAPLAARSAI